MLELLWVGNRQTIQELSDIVWAQDSTVVFLAETWLDETRLIGIRDKLRLGHYHRVSKINRGGLALFWKHGFNLDVDLVSNHIDALIN